MAGFQAFAGDHNDQLPGCFWDTQAQTDSNVDHMDWLCGNSSAWHNAPAAGTLFRYIKSAASYRCPGLDSQQPPDTAMIGPGVGSNGHFDYVAMVEFTGARLSNIPLTSHWMNSPTSFDSYPTPVIVEGDPAQMNRTFVNWHGSTFPMTHNHHGGGYYATVDGSVQWINEPDGGCANWWAQTPSGTWKSLGDYPYLWGQWNNQ
jgi:hypothetical protein